MRAEGLDAPGWHARSREEGKAHRERRNRSLEQRPVFAIGGEFVGEGYIRQIRIASTSELKEEFDLLLTDPIGLGGFEIAQYGLGCPSTSPRSMANMLR